MAEDLLTSLWNELEEEDTMTVDILDLRRRHADLERTVSRRNQRELFAGGLVLALFGARALWATDPWEVAGSAMVAVGAVVVSWWIHTRAQPLEVEPAVDTRSFLAQRRAELLHQATLLERVPLWYIGPILPGLLVLTMADWPGMDAGIGLAAWGVGALGLVAITAGIVWINHQAARALRDEAEALGGG